MARIFAKPAQEYRNEFLLVLHKVKDLFFEDGNDWEWTINYDVPNMPQLAESS
jgi:hypothetical protein